MAGLDGLEKGIKRLSDLNVLLPASAGAILSRAQPLYRGARLRKRWSHAAKLYTNEFYTDAAGTTAFVEAWTVFYWAKIALGPYMGVFITKISRGRTLRELILGGIGYGTLGYAVFFAILGNYALYLELNQFTQSYRP